MSGWRADWLAARLPQGRAACSPPGWLFAGSSSAESLKPKTCGWLSISAGWVMSGWLAEVPGQLTVSRPPGPEALCMPLTGHTGQLTANLRLIVLAQPVGEASQRTGVQEWPSAGDSAGGHTAGSLPPGASAPLPCGGRAQCPRGTGLRTHVLFPPLLPCLNAQLPLHRFLGSPPQDTPWT